MRERVGSREVVRAASAEARAEGVVVGMRRREAEARCPDAVFADADPPGEARAFEVVARAVERITPRFELERPGLLSFPTRGPARYFGGDDALAGRVNEAVTAVLDLGEGLVPVRIGIAGGRFAARLAARRADPVRVIAPSDTATFLAPWPVAVLGDPDLAQLLVRLGLPTLGAFATLDPDAVAARFGAEGRRLHALAGGGEETLPVLTEPPPDLVEDHELDPPAARVDAAAFAAKALADQLVERLAERGLACTRVVVEAETEHGEHLSRCWRHDGAFTPGALAERVRWQLDGWLAANRPVLDGGEAASPRERQDALVLAEGGLDSTTGALTRLRLVPDEVVPAAGRQLGFWGGDQAATDRADRALTRVQGMLGYDAVVTAVPQGGRTPSERVRWVPWGESVSGSAEPIRGERGPSGPALQAPRAGDNSLAAPPGAASQPREPERLLVAGGEVAAWPGALPPPSPARIFAPPLPAELLDADGRPVVVTARGETSAAPTHLRCAALPRSGGRLSGWAGPWLHDVRWWDPSARRRRVMWQVVVEPDPGQAVACLVVVERGTAAVEAIYD